MRLALQNFSTLVESMAASAQGASSALLDVSVGSVMRALLESSASVGLWLQYLILQVLSLTRLSSCVGGDADSWVADYGMTRLPATAADGVVTMTSFNPGAQGSVISDGMTVRLSDGTQSFSVIGGPYVRPLGMGSIDVSIQAMAAGVLGNVQPGTINVLGSAIPGIDTVSNAAALSGGMEAETDEALRKRFVDYINTRAQATEQALIYAAKSVGLNVSAMILENVTADGSPMPGNIHVIADDGTGAPTAALLSQISDAIDIVRPVGTTVTVAAPSVILVSVTCELVLDSSADGDSLVKVVASAIEAFVNGLAVGQVLPYSKLSSVIYGVSTLIDNVRNLEVNGDRTDLGGVIGKVVRCQSVVATAVGQ